MFVDTDCSYSSRLVQCENAVLPWHLFSIPKKFARVLLARDHSVCSALSCCHQQKMVRLSSLTSTKVSIVHINIVYVDMCRSWRRNLDFNGHAVLATVFQLCGELFLSHGGFRSSIPRHVRTAIVGGAQRTVPVRTYRQRGDACRQVLWG